MNTNAVSQLLGVSSSTVQRWVKHLGLEMERNEFGHYVYSEENIDNLKEFQQKLQKGIAIQNISTQKKRRQGTTTTVVRNQTSFKEEKWMEKIRELESRLNNKADSVVAYQLMQHRSDIEELEEKVALLSEQLDELLENQLRDDDIEKKAESDTSLKKKKKTFLGAIFS